MQQHWTVWPMFCQKMALLTYSLNLKLRLSYSYQSDWKNTSFGEAKKWLPLLRMQRRGVGSSKHYKIYTVDITHSANCPVLFRTFHQQNPYSAGGSVTIQVTLDLVHKTQQLILVNSREFKRNRKYMWNRTQNVKNQNTEKHLGIK